MGKFLDEAIARYGAMTEKHMADFKAEMMPFFTKHGITEDKVSVVDYQTSDKWTVAVLFPTKGLSEEAMEKQIVSYFQSIGGDEEDQILAFSDERRGYFEWEVTLPACPKGIRDASAADWEESKRLERERGEIERKKREAVMAERTRQLVEAIRSGRLRGKSRNPLVYLTMDYYNYDLIALPDDDLEAKRVEFREASDYYMNKFFGSKAVPVRFVKLQRGYGGKGHDEPVQQIWTVETIKFVDEYGEEAEPGNIPDGFVIDMIAIHLGKRITAAELPLEAREIKTRRKAK